MKLFRSHFCCLLCQCCEHTTLMETMKVPFVVVKANFVKKTLTAQKKQISGKSHALLFLFPAMAVHPHTKRQFHNSSSSSCCFEAWVIFHKRALFCMFLLHCKRQTHGNLCCHFLSLSFALSMFSHNIAMPQCHNVLNNVCKCGSFRNSKMHRWWCALLLAGKQ